ncbi:flagellar associated protein [Dunaliella salina]|uniref:Flagellar associated protein n=1 Tax=Dunaliella salina TaxID=3046 RepID=A0ABQ7H295_DUNSA|nr:flagellar associated protein [Dunaliella salina]|eukprot:KAF5840975.1 flagellar associated protein [Dunaliella salina]
MDFSERWTRGAGSGGLGQSGHKNEYRHGVLISNFVEDGAKEDFSRTGKHLLGFGEPFQATSTHRADHNPEGRTGDDLLFISQRQDQRLNTKGMPGDFLTRHGNFAGPRENFYATMNQLAYGPKQHGDPRVDTFIWTGQNRHDAGGQAFHVFTPLITRYPTTTPIFYACVLAVCTAFHTPFPMLVYLQSAQHLTAVPAAQQPSPDTQHMVFPMLVRLQSVQHSSALPAAEYASKRKTLPPIADSGHLSTVGRKPKGQHADELDKNYRRTGLRDNWHKP